MNEGEKLTLHIPDLATGRSATITGSGPMSDETEHLLSSPANAARLRDGIAAGSVEILAGLLADIDRNQQTRDAGLLQAFTLLTDAMKRQQAVLDDIHRMVVDVRKASPPTIEELVTKWSQ